MHHRLVVQGSWGQAPTLAPPETLPLGFIAEAVKVGICMNTGDLRVRMADLMSPEAHWRGARPVRRRGPRRAGLSRGPRGKKTHDHAPQHHLLVVY